ncbi:MAG TPA: DNA polymerase III subunit gamma/tau [Opitutaceae bacterium]|jgi:DNA polymerase-3 subunit delta'|nr:DNA polymerase III subunit gamma/tau [Opitutaceae bacterium]
MTAVVPWPPAFAGTPAVSVIERAIGRGRLSHSLLLAGDDAEGLSAAGLALADRLLNRGGSHNMPPDRHPDCIQVRPAGKSRSIKVDSIRDLVARVNVSASVSRYKVVVIHDAERMNASAANILLKTLEEPPADTTILLLTTRPYALLPTIRSRVLHFRFPGMATELTAEGWPAWVADYRAWLTQLGQGVSAGRKATDSIFSLYGLVARFGSMLDRAASTEVARRKQGLPEGLEDDEIAAIEAEATIGLRMRMFAEIETATRNHANASPDESAKRFLTASVDSLERSAGLLRVNLNESAALEDYLLSCLRIWTKR